MAEKKIYTSEDIVTLVTGLGSGVKGNRTFYFENGQLKFARRFKTPQKENIIVILSQTELRDGLTSARWDYVDKQLLKLQEKSDASPTKKP